MTGARTRKCEFQMDPAPALRMRAKVRRGVNDAHRKYGIWNDLIASRKEGRRIRL